MTIEPITTQTDTRSVLQSLRSLIPERSNVTFTEALRIAEIQAARLLTTTGIDDYPVPDETITGLPRIRLEYIDQLPSFGLSFWKGRHWIIQLSTRQAHVRQRFTLFHEYKHIIDHGFRDRLYRGDQRRAAPVQAELAADYFAGCALIPRRELKRAWAELLIQRPAELAQHFDVSQQAIEVRLDQIGLTERPQRCSSPTASGSWRLRDELGLGRAM